MDDLFKKKLAELRSPKSATTFGEALLNPGDWEIHSVKTTDEKKVVITEEYSEKSQVIESLGRFAEEKIKEDGPGSILKIEGGEIALKPEGHWEDIPEAQDQDELLDFLTLPPEALDALVAHKEASRIKILFVTEAYNSEEVERDGLKRELQFCFPTKSVEFTERMILAMKIPPEEMVFYPIENEGEVLGEEVMAVARYFKPSVIVTFGAKAANTLLKRNDKLSLFQGQFFNRNADEDKFTIVPLYHPFILETNPNMKKLTWENMQKIMVHLKNHS